MLWCVYLPACPDHRSPAPRPPPSPPAPPCPGQAAADGTVSAGERVACAFACLLAVTDLVDGFVAGVLQAQVDHGVLQRPAHVELQGQIVHPLEKKKKRTGDAADFALKLQEMHRCTAGLQKHLVQKTTSCWENCADL